MYRNLSVNFQRVFSSSSFEDSYNFIGKTGVIAALSSSDESRLLVASQPRNVVVSLSTCSKLCAIFFVAGVVVGHPKINGVWKWASKLLRILKNA